MTEDPWTSTQVRVQEDGAAISEGLARLHDLLEATCARWNFLSRWWHRREARGYRRQAADIRAGDADLACALIELEQVFPTPRAAGAVEGGEGRDEIMNVGFGKHLEGRAALWQAVIVYGIAGQLFRRSKKDGHFLTRMCPCTQQEVLDQDRKDDLPSVIVSDHMLHCEKAVSVAAIYVNGPHGLGVVIMHADDVRGALATPGPPEAMALLQHILEDLRTSDMRNPDDVVLVSSDGSSILPDPASKDA